MWLYSYYYIIFYGTTHYWRNTQQAEIDFIEINEKISAVFNSNGFAIHIKVNGLVLVKNYIIKKINCIILFNDNFCVIDDAGQMVNEAFKAAK